MQRGISETKHKMAHLVSAQAVEDILRGTVLLFLLIQSRQVTAGTLNILR